MGAINRNSQRPDLKKLLAYWQPRLRLQDWRIKVRYAVNRTESGDTFGKIRMSLNLKEAEIVICPIDLIDPHWLGEQDIEVSFVHELLHLHARPIENVIPENDSLACASVEIMLESIAQALVRVRWNK